MLNYSSLTAAATCAGLLFVCVDAANAAPVALPPAAWGFGSSVGIGPDFSGISNNLEVQSTASPLPSITATAISSASNRLAGAQGNLSYAIMVSGPSGAVPVSLKVTAFGSLFSVPGSNLAGSSIGSGSRARLNVDNQLLLDLISDQGLQNGAFSMTNTITVTTNAIIGVQMIAYALTQGIQQTAVTYIDPLFSLDLDLITAGYTIITSAGIGNVAPNPIPLPASLPTLFGALGVLGWLARRRLHQ